MKGIYTILIIAAVITVLMIAAAFIYIDQQKRQTLLYELYRDNELIGYEKVDIFRLENSMIYKSVTKLPFNKIRTEITRKASFGIKGKKLFDYTQETTNNGALSTLYILKGPEKVSYMATGHADFSYLDSVPSYGNDLIFQREAIVTYPTLIRRYNFKKRGEQYVNVLTPISTFIPPARDVVSINSAGRDILEINGRKISCERLLLGLKNGDLISVWIAGRRHNILKVDMPKYGFKAIFSTEKRDLPAEKYKKQSELYTEKEVTFKNEEVSLYGTLSVPSGGRGPYPAVLLIWDSGPLDREACGMFTDLAYYLAGSGYCVLRFDKRGIGKSQGLFATYAQPELISDLKCAIDYLKSVPVVDSGRIALLGHSEGGFYAAYLCGQDSGIRACIMMSAISSLNPLDNDCRKLKRFIAKVAPNDIVYLESALLSLSQSRNIAWGKSDWESILGKRVFTKKMNLEEKYNVIDAMKKLKAPVLILHGRKDSLNMEEEVKEVESALRDGGNDDFTTIYFGKLDESFGETVKRPPVIDHIELDPEVPESIINWLNNNLTPLPKEPAEQSGEKMPADI